jgi:hypothetical protein
MAARSPLRKRLIFAHPERVLLDFDPRPGDGASVARTGIATQLGALTAAMIIAVVVAGCGSGFCDKHTCISSFDNGHGYIVQCADGEWSHSGGEQGACSYHGGETSVTASDSGQTQQSSTTSGYNPPQPPPTTTASASDFCSSHPCITGFDSGTGSIVKCGDGLWSHSGGVSGACSHHGGVAVAGAGGGSARPPVTPPQSVPSVPSVPPTPPIPAGPPPSHPTLTGPRSGSSNGYSMNVTSFMADHSLDLAGYAGSPPQFGINFTADCADAPSGIGSWTITTGTDPREETFGTCISGTFGTALTLAVLGCGSHTLSAVVKEVGTDRVLGGPIRVPFHVC